MQGLKNVAYHAPLLKWYAQSKENVNRERDSQNRNPIQGEVKGIYKIIAVQQV